MGKKLTSGKRWSTFFESSSEMNQETWKSVTTKEIHRKIQIFHFPPLESHLCVRSGRRSREVKVSQSVGEEDELGSSSACCSQLGGRREKVFPPRDAEARIKKWLDGTWCWIHMQFFRLGCSRLGPLPLLVRVFVSASILPPAWFPCILAFAKWGEIVYKSKTFVRKSSTYIESDRGGVGNGHDWAKVNSSGKKV